jgi:hypothetical protein
MIFAFGHRKQQGKDTCVNILADYMNKHTMVDPVICSFARPLYACCKELVPEFFSKSFYDAHPERKEVKIDRLGKSPRQILIDVGQSLKQTLGPDCFARAVLSRELEQWERMLISDLRFPVEAKMVREKGGVLIKVVRPTIMVEGDSVDDVMEEWTDWDEVIVNDGTLEDLRGKVIDMFGRRNK